MEVQLSIIDCWTEPDCENTMIKMSSVTESRKYAGLGKIIPLRPRKVHIYLQQQHFGIKGPILVR